MARKFMASLYDQKGNFKECHNDLNILRAKLASKRISALRRLPPSEAALEQHAKRVTWQVTIWTHSHVAQPECGDITQYGWKKTLTGLAPVMYDGPNAAEILRMM